MKRIYLGKKKFATVDDADFKWLNHWNWYAHQNHRKGHVVFYACHRIRRKITWMHRLILGARGRIQIDHRDGSGLNNQRHNIRCATGSQNQHAFRRKQGKTTSRFKGVYWETAREKWVAKTKVHGRFIFLGRFDQEIDAQKAYQSFPHDSVR